MQGNAGAFWVGREQPEEFVHDRPERLPKEPGDRVEVVGDDADNNDDRRDDLRPDFRLGAVGDILERDSGFGFHVFVLLVDIFWGWGANFFYHTT